MITSDDIRRNVPFKTLILQEENVCLYSYIKFDGKYGRVEFHIQSPHDLYGTFDIEEAVYLFNYLLQENN